MPRSPQCHACSIHITNESISLSSFERLINIIQLIADYDIILVY
jgi:hypothetical protein